MSVIDEICMGVSKLTIADFFSVKDYFYATISAAIGCWGGIRWANKKAKERQEQIDAESVLSLIAAFEKTRKLAQDAALLWAQKGSPNFPLENQRIISLCERVSKFKDSELRTAIEGFVYQCSHYNSKLTVVNIACLDAILHNNHTDLLGLYKSGMKKDAEDIFGWSSSALEKLKKE